jgi:ATP-binding cassette, subfamily F, member 3
MTQFSMAGVSVKFGASTILTDVTFTVAAGERWGMIGRNGSGKTTLFRLLTGEVVPAAGAIAKNPGLRFAVLDQHRDFQGATTVWNAVSGAFQDLIDLEHDLARQAHAMSEASAEATEALLARYARDLERFEHEDTRTRHGWTPCSRAWVSTQWPRTTRNSST